MSVMGTGQLSNGRLSVDGSFSVQRSVPDPGGSFTLSGGSLTIAGTLRVNNDATVTQGGGALAVDSAELAFRSALRRPPAASFRRAP